MRGREAAIGNLIADAMRERTRADAAIMNGGGIRGGKVYEPGTAITRRDVQAELPFGNHLVALDVKGSDLRLAIENGLSRLPAAAGRFPQVSGMTVEFDPRQPAGSRVLTITVGGAPLDANKTYRVAVNDFMARGGDGYSLRRDRSAGAARRHAAAVRRGDDLSARARQRAERRRRPHDRQIAKRRRACLRGGACFHEAEADQRPARNSRPATPAATLRPVWACPLSGCKAMVLPEPPISALAPRPTPTVALAAAPP